MKKLLILLLLIIGFSYANANENDFKEHTVLVCISETNYSYKSPDPYMIIKSYYAYDGYNLKYLGRAKKDPPYFRNADNSSFKLERAMDGYSEITFKTDKYLYNLNKKLRFIDIYKYENNDFNTADFKSRLICEKTDNSLYVRYIDYKKERSERIAKCERHTNKEKFNYLNKLEIEFKKDNNLVFDKIINELDNLRLSYSGTNRDDLKIITDKKRSEYNSEYYKLDKIYEEKFKKFECGDDFDFSKYDYVGMWGDKYLKLILQAGYSHDIAVNNIKERTNSISDNESKITNLESSIKQLEKQLSNKNNKKCYRKSAAWEYWKDKTCKTDNCKREQIQDLRNQLSSCSSGKSDDDIFYETVGGAIMSIFD